MKITLLIPVCFLVGLVVADVKELKNKQIPIISLESKVEHDGNFFYSYESGDGSKANQEGSLKVFDKDSAGEVVQGQFSYIGDDGQTYRIQYTADENGYVPYGDHLPTSPPIPEAIQKALNHLATAQPPKQLK